MNYYFVEYVQRTPNGFGGIAQAPIIKKLSKYKVNSSLLEHEKIFRVCHRAVAPLVADIVSLGVFLHQLQYKLVSAYRCWCEVQAYRKQIAIGRHTNNQLAVVAPAKKYDLGLSVDEADLFLRTCVESSEQASY